jgi:hypothetical protein
MSGQVVPALTLLVTITSAALLAPGRSAAKENPDKAVADKANNPPKSETCASLRTCHATPPGNNQGQGSVKITQLENRTTYTACAKETLEVVITDTDATRIRWGFEVTVVNGANPPETVAELRNGDKTTKLLASGDKKRAFVTHSKDGMNTSTWSFTWEAPKDGDVTFYVVGLVANGNGDKSGDWVYTKSYPLTKAASLGQGDPFGGTCGDDTGFIPPDAPSGPTTLCETGVAKAVARLVKDITHCHQRRASGRLDASGEEACEAVAASTFQQQAGALGCPPGSCAVANLPTTASTVESVLDEGTAAIFCDTTSGEPFGGDDTGYVPADSVIAACEDRVARASVSLVRRLVTCHTRLARLKIPDEEAAERCEMAAAAAFEGKISAVSGCPPCTDAVNVLATTDALLDTHNDLVFCASPSGAFLDGVADEP